MKRLAILTTLSLTLIAIVWWTQRAPQPGLIVLISIDTLRADRLPIYGYRAGRTPALDGLATEAVVFDRAYAHAPQTLPSHTSMLTGQLPFEHGVRDNLGFTLGAGATTVQSLLSSAGYRTAAFVSSFVLRPDTGLAQGFDTYDATLPPSATDRSPGQVQRGGMQTFEAADRWLTALDRDQAFLFFHIYEPHKPYTPPPTITGLTDPYDGEVAYADQIVGRLLDRLRALGRYDDALIVVTADHGEGLGDHGEEEHGLFLYDEVMRVPLIVKLPGQEHGGRRSNVPVQHIDLMPTLLAAHGVATPAGRLGRDLGPVLRGEGSIASTGIYAEALYARYHFGWSELLSLTDERYRYIDAPREELYDLERDPRERTNVAGDRAQIALAMRAGLQTLTRDRALEAPAAVSDADRQRLAALGYVGTQTTTTARDGAALPDPKDKAHILRLYREAVDHLSASRLADGARVLDVILKEDPGMTDVWSQYATTLVRMGQLERAYAAWREVVERKPDEPSGLLGAAAVLVSLQRYDTARTYAELAITRAPEAAHQALANIALQQGKNEQALAEAAAAEKADPTLPMTLMVRGLIAYNDGRYADAVPLLQQARERFATRPLQPADLHFFIGDALARLERYGEAEPLLREELRLYPHSIRASTGLAMLMAATGRPAEADRALTDLMRAVPAPQTFETAANLYTMFGLTERAAAVRRAMATQFGR